MKAIDAPNAPDKERAILQIRYSDLRSMGFPGIPKTCSKSQIAVRLRTEGLGVSRRRRRDGKHFAGRGRPVGGGGRFRVANLEDRCPLRQLQSAVDQIGHNDPAGNLRREKDERE
jgi:hypothetical protein